MTGRRISGAAPCRVGTRDSLAARRRDPMKSSRDVQLEQTDHMPLLLRKGFPWPEGVADPDEMDRLEEELVYNPQSQKSEGLWAKGHVYTFVSTSTGKKDKQERRYDPA